MENLEHLIEAIRSALGPTSGLDSDDIDHNQLIALIEAYRSEESDWHPFAFFDANRNYTRNLVDDTNGKSNILVVCWVRLAAKSNERITYNSTESWQRQPHT